MGGLKIVDMSNDANLKRLDWGTNAPAWWTAGHGLCLEGVCNNSTCVANGQDVIMPIGYAKFDLSTQQIISRAPTSIVSSTSNASTIPTCPMCSQYVEAKRFAFNNCWWKFQGFKENYEACSSDWHYADNAYHRFDDNPTAKVIWIGLVLEVVQERPT